MLSPLPSPAPMPLTAACPTGSRAVGLCGVTANCAALATPPSRIPPRPQTTDAALMVRFNLPRAALAKFNRVAKMLTALRVPRAAQNSAQRALTEHYAYRQKDFAALWPHVGHDSAISSSGGGEWRPHEVALLWLQSDIALLGAKLGPAKQWGRAAATLAGSASEVWKSELLENLGRLVDATCETPQIQALALLHAEDIRVTMEPMRWFTRPHTRAIRAAIQRDPLQFRARFTLAATSYLRQKGIIADAQYLGAAIAMMGQVKMPPPPDIWALPGRDEAQVWYRRWSWLARTFLDEPLFAYAAAEAATAVGDDRGALAHEQDVVLQLPNCAYGHQAQAQTLTRLGDYPAARRAWSRAVDLDYAWPSALRALGALEAEAGRIEEARWYFSAAAYDAEGPLDAHLDDATACMQVDAYPAAQKSLEAALAINVDCAAAVTNLALLLTSMGRLTEAYDLLQAARARASFHAFWQADSRYALQLANVCVALGRADMAHAAFVEATSLSADPLAVHVEAAASLGDLGAHDAARVHHAAIADSGSQDIEHMFNFALSYLRDNRPVQALSLLLRTEPQGEHASEHHYLIGKAHQKLGHVAVADMRFAEAIRVFAPKTSEHIRIRLGTMRDAVKMLLSAGKPAQALARAQAYVELEDDAHLHLQCAEAALACQQWDVCCAHANRCLKLDPDAHGPWRLLWALPDGTEGKPTLFACLIGLGRAMPEVFSIHWLLAMEAIEHDESELALAAARRAVALEPNHTGAVQTLALAESL